MEKRPFFRADTAGLGKYSTGGYGRIGVYRVKDRVKWPRNCPSLTVEIVQCDTYGDTLTVNGSQSNPI